MMMMLLLLPRNTAGTPSSLALALSPALVLALATALLVLQRPRDSRVSQGTMTTACIICSSNPGH